MPEQIKASDLIAQYLKDRGIRYVFGIIGSANSHIFDSITTLGYTKIVCVHHEQAATMAMQTYYRTCGEITAAIVTAGGGSTNAITGVASAWADSIPGVVISGQENAKYIQTMFDMRMWGIQGYDSTQMVEKITKYSSRILKPEQTLFELQKAWHIAGSGRPGPVWLDVPMDVQGSYVDKSACPEFVPEKSQDIQLDKVNDEKIDDILNLIREAKRPVFWFGHGIRLSGAEKDVVTLLESFPFPFLLSWAAADLIDVNHHLNFGRAGVYGQRASNFALQNADLVIAIGTRLSISMVGYVHNEFLRAGKLVHIDIDQNELEKHSDIPGVKVSIDAKKFINRLLSRRNYAVSREINQWTSYCAKLRSDFPLVESAHADQKGYINTYRLMERMEKFLKDDQYVCTDMGTALLCAHQGLSLKKGQRLMTSTGLGEMGYGLPAAIGISFARSKGEVLCLNCDGGMMMNLQELQTIVYHKLPIKIIVFNNDGYLMIKHTQKNLFKGRYSGTDFASGVSCPDFSKVASAFDLPYYSIKTWGEFDSVFPDFQANEGPALCDVFMDPEQLFVPKLAAIMGIDGKIVSPPLEDLSPLVSREQLREIMIAGVHEKSERL